MDTVVKVAQYTLANATMICQYRTAARNRRQEFNDTVLLAEGSQMEEFYKDFVYS